MREVSGVPFGMIGHFSARRARIEARYAGLVRAYRREHGHDPSRAACHQLARQANLDTRAAKKPAAVFEADPDLSAVWLRHGQAAVGTVRRHRLQLLGLLGPGRTTEDGDGAQLPGVSTQYQLLQYRCLAPGCEILELRVVLGTDGPPSCPRGHGPLELKA